MKKYVGIDIGGTDIKYGLVNADGSIMDKNKRATNSSGEEILSAIKDIVSGYQVEFDVAAVGVSVPGIVQEDGYLITGGAIHDFYEYPLKAKLETLLNLPVTVENDGNCAALAEKWLGAGKDAHNFLTVVVGTGIGGGFILNDELFRGATSTAGELGFMIIEPIKEDDVRMATLSLTASVQCGLVDKYATGNAPAEALNGKKIFTLASKGDMKAKEVIEQFYNRLAKGLFNVAVTFDPEVILIGGGISTNTIFIDELNQRVAELKANHRDMKNIHLAPIHACAFLNDAGLIGATYKAVKESEIR